MATEENQILARCKDGDRESFRWVVTTYQQRIFSVALKMLADEEEAKDVVQETFICVWQKLDAYDLQRPFSTWLYTIATRLCLNRLKQMRTVSSLPLDEQALHRFAADADSYRTLENREWASIVRLLAEEPVTDAATGLSTVKWQNTENRHVEGRDGRWAKSVIMTSRTSTGSFERDATFPYVKATSPLVPCGWELIEEDGETVLHCYMKMPADVVTNFWLASDETALVDSETGVQYRARRSNPDNWGQYFHFRAMKDSIVDLRIYFPLLPPETSSVYIYGVPNWRLNGGSTISINRPNMYHVTISPYDAPPEFHKPRLVREARNYNKDNSGSWAEYTDAHLIRPLKHNTMALWRTADATFIAVAREQNWTREYFGEGPGDMLIDNNGKQYRLKEVQDYPNGNLFWVRGNSGDWIAFLKVYEPLAPGVRTINYIVPEGEPFKAWGANWSGTVESNLDVEQLRRNQKFFEYHPRVVVE